MRPMKYRAVTRALRSVGCRFLREGPGDHEVWICPCGRHETVITEDTEVSAGVLRNVVRDLNCLPKGWLK